MSVRVHLVRHGRTVYNDEERLQGWSDSALTEVGRAAAHREASRWASTDVVALYSSPSPRAAATARLLFPAAEPIFDPDLREYHFGEWEARRAEDIVRDPDVLALGWSFESLVDGTAPALPGGESAQSFDSRVLAALTRIRSAHEFGDVVVVTHGITIASLMRQHGRPARPVENLAAVTLEFSPVRRGSTR
ncbi:putative phosphoglycerate mutase [Microbacterium sp. SORGH_AS 1204]|uniref:histidine phosphatase family protein n=1 Tax=Microbacterium sp. SORGH_AS_1204 TaxID=3041785 RepID=UPI00278F7082|nr:histidine phosphatase family protein [Microbacterium sp. SORGH_AS_1204]MDQ1136307.1 putative phosphoglycerate mutase [Microbacterium sp. SORGH_AS_1204]